MKTLQNKINRYKKGFLFVSILFLGYACSDLLNENVDDRLRINTLDKMQETLDGLYLSNDFLFNNYMSDDYSFNYYSSNVDISLMHDIGNYFTFRATRESLSSREYDDVTNGPNFSWLHYYKIIHHSSFILNAATKYGLKSESEKAKKNTIIAQAKAIRAYCHFMLLSLFAKPYTIKEEYDFIKQELLNAHELINDDLVDYKPFNFTKISIEALLARLYLYKKEWKKCIEFSDKVIDRRPGELVDVQALFTQYMAEETKPKDLSKHYFNPDEQKSYLLMSKAGMLTLVSDDNTAYYPLTLEDFFKKDGKTLTRSYYFESSRQIYPNIVPTKFFYLTVFPLLSVDETYYNRAEAYIEDGQLDKAKEDLKLLVAKDAFIKKEEDGSISQDQTFISKLPGIHDKKELMNYLLDAKRMRFYCEGMRWFDMRRHGLPVTHTNNAGTFTIDGNDPQAYVIMPPLEEVKLGGNECK